MICDASAFSNYHDVTTHEEFCKDRYEQNTYRHYGEQCHDIKECG